MDQYQSFEVTVPGNKYNIVSNIAIRRLSTSQNFVTTIAGKYCLLKNIAKTSEPSFKNCYTDGNGTIAGLSRVSLEDVSSQMSVGNKLYFTDYVMVSLALLLTRLRLMAS